MGIWGDGPAAKAAKEYRRIQEEQAAVKLEVEPEGDITGNAPVVETKVKPEPVEVVEESRAVQLMNSIDRYMEMNGQKYGEGYMRRENVQMVAEFANHTPEEVVSSLQVFFSIRDTSWWSEPCKQIPILADMMEQKLLNYAEGLRNEFTSYTTLIAVEQIGDLIKPDSAVILRQPWIKDKRGPIFDAALALHQQNPDHLVKLAESSLDAIAALKIAVAGVIEMLPVKYAELNEQAEQFLREIVEIEAAQVRKNAERASKDL